MPPLTLNVILNKQETALFYLISFKVIIPCSWIFGVILNIPWILLENYSEELGACSGTWPAKWMIKAYSMTWFLLMGFLPVSLMAALYIRVVYALWFKRGEHSQQQVFFFHSFYSMDKNRLCHFCSRLMKSAHRHTYKL